MSLSDTEVRELRRWLLGHEGQRASLRPEVLAQVEEQEKAEEIKWNTPLYVIKAMRGSQ